MEEKSTDKLECPFCGGNPFDGVIGDTEFTAVEGVEEYTCRCGAHLLIYYDLKFSHIEASKKTGRR